MAIEAFFIVDRPGAGMAKLPEYLRLVCQCLKALAVDRHIEDSVEPEGKTK